MHPATWPSSASTAVQLAYGTAGVAGAAAIAALSNVAGGHADAESWLVLLLSLPSLGGLVLGAELLRRRIRRGVLVASAVFSAVAVVVTSLSGFFVVYRDSVFVAFALAPLFVIPLPIVAATLAMSHDVGYWLSGRLHASGGPVARP